MQARFTLFSLSSTWKLRFRRFSSISLPFVVEPYFYGCPVKVVQFCKFLKDKGIAFSSKAKKSELVQIFNTQADYVTAYDGCFPKPKQVYFAA